MSILRKISTFAATMSLLFVIGCSATQDRESVGEVIDDTVITAKVKAALIDDEDLSASEIKVETFKGTVQLSGFVSDRSDIAKATAVTNDIDGVVSVKNDLVLK
ncbi:MAG: BON domain-containing protein [Pseudomonadota bacterium]